MNRANRLLEIGAEGIAQAVADANLKLDHMGYFDERYGRCCAVIGAAIALDGVNTQVFKEVNVEGIWHLANHIDVPESVLSSIESGYEGFSVRAEYDENDETDQVLIPFFELGVKLRELAHDQDREE